MNESILAKEWYQKTWVIVLFLIFIFPVGIYLTLRYSKWNKLGKIGASIVSIFLFLLYLISFSEPVKIASLSLEKQNISIELNESKSIAIFYSSGGDSSQIELVAENSNITFEKDTTKSTATKLYGTITGIAEGESRIYVKTRDNTIRSATSKITIVDTIKQKAQQDAIVKQQLAQQEEQAKLQKEEQAKKDEELKKETAKQEAQQAKQTESTKRTNSATSATSSKTNTTKKTATKETTRGIFYTRTGECYHYKNPCGRGTYYPCTLSEAKSKGLRPCQKCVL